MRRNNCRIGFDDRLVMIIAIPVLSFIVPIVFLGCRFSRYPFFTWDKFLTSFVITASLWLGNRYIMIYSRNKFPLFSDVKKRLIRQSVYMAVFTFVCHTTLGFIDWKYIKHEFDQIPWTELMISANAASFFCTIMIIAIYESIYFMNELKKSVEETEHLKRANLSAQLNALRTQVNPHFLFNNLNTLSAIIPESPGQAVNFVQQLSKVYRHILEVKDEKSISLEHELEVLNAYAFLLKTRFGNNLAIDIRVEKEKMGYHIVPLSLQLLMENAIKHNIVSSEKPLKIDVYTMNGSLVVTNNLQRKNQIQDSTGIGLENIRSRYQLMGNQTMEVIERANEFKVSIPLIAN